MKCLDDVSFRTIVARVNCLRLAVANQFDVLAFSRVKGLRT